ncbi:Arc family DNA-binding protein [Comamonas sp. UBA7528]|uniref:Arc family DNA-binding protein n=1 Tax=Comamonas sp. UBA7528 TaxID=1946391 RepID=UPI0025BC6585|nr:Arc family DNA-binding protein [Comamonas sp. UBA7528]
MSREDPQMKIRLPADLKDQIEAASKQSGRSMNAEIVARLEKSFAWTASDSRVLSVGAIQPHSKLQMLVKRVAEQAAEIAASDLLVSFKDLEDQGDWKDELEVFLDRSKRHATNLSDLEPSLKVKVKPKSN